MTPWPLFFADFGSFLSLELVNLWTLSIVHKLIMELPGYRFAPIVGVVRVG